MDVKTHHKMNKLNKKKVDTCFMNRGCDYPFQSEEIRENLKKLVK